MVHARIAYLEFADGSAASTVKVALEKSYVFLTILLFDVKKAKRTDARHMFC